MQIRGPLAMVKAFFTHEAANVYFGITGGKVLNLPVGLTRNILPLAKDYSGIRNLLAGPPLTVALFLLTLVLPGRIFCGMRVVPMESAVENDAECTYSLRSGDGRASIYGCTTRDMGLKL